MTTVFLDRVIGLLGLVLLAGVMILVAWDTSNFGQIGLILGVVCGGLAIGALSAGRRWRCDSTRGWLGRRC